MPGPVVRSGDAVVLPDVAPGEYRLVTLVGQRRRCARDRRAHHHPLTRYAAFRGAMLGLNRKTLSGSYAVFASTSRP